MSTKIWTAWRFPQKRLNEFIDIVHPQLWARVIQEAEKLMAMVLDEAVVKRRDEMYPDGLPAHADRSVIDRHIKAEMVIDLAVQARAHDVWQPSLDCGFNLWMHNGKVYVIPFGAPIFYENLALPEWAEDFAYWNNTDPPKGVTWERWSRRGRVWDAVCTGGDDNWDGHRLTHSVCDMDRAGGSLSAARISMHFMDRTRNAEPAASTRGQESE